MIEVVPDVRDVEAWRPAAADRMLARRLAAGVPEGRAREGVAWQVARSDEIRSQPWSVRRDGDEVGTAWTLARDDVRHLLDLDVPVGLAAQALDALREVLRSDDGRHLVVDVFSGDDVASAAIAGVDVPVQAAQMQLDVTAPVATPGRVELRPLTAAEFGTYREHLVTGYAQEMFEAGSYDDLPAALAASEQATADLLPQGPDTPRHHLWTAYDGDVPVAVLWVHEEGSFAYIYDIEVRPEHRRRGYGREVLDAGALAARDLGARVLGLNVFGHNEGARAMYEQAGYAVTELTYRIAL